MIAFKPWTPTAKSESAARALSSADEWLGRNSPGKRRLWEQLSPLHRKQLYALARVLALRQRSAALPEPLRAQLADVAHQVERLTSRIESLLAALAAARRV
jgi:hypothetical protein